MSIARQIVRVEEPKPLRAAEKVKAGLIKAIAVAKGETETSAIHVRRGRKPSENAKKLLTLRIDPDVIEHFKSGGEGWQSRMNDALRKAAHL